jgi:hypothetical protein
LLHKSGITDKTSIFRLELANHPRIVKCPALKRFLLLMLSWTAITLLATGDLAQAVEIAARAMALSLSREGAAREHALSFRGFGRNKRNPVQQVAPFGNCRTAE